MIRISLTTGLHEKYTLVNPFNLRCESGILYTYKYVSKHIFLPAIYLLMCLSPFNAF